MQNIQRPVTRSLIQSLCLLYRPDKVVTDYHIPPSPAE